MNRLTPIAATIGATLITIGVALISPPAGLITAGAITFTVALLYNTDT